MSTVHFVIMISIDFQFEEMYLNIIKIAGKNMTNVSGAMWLWSQSYTRVPQQDEVTKLPGHRSLPAIVNFVQVCWD